MFKETPFTKTQLALQDSDDVRKDLSDLRDIWELVDSTEKEVVIDETIKVLNNYFDELRKTGEIKEKPMIVADTVNFNKGDKVTAKLFFDDQEKIVEIDVNRRRLKKKDIGEMKNKLFPRDMIVKALLTNNRGFWNSVLHFRTIFGYKAEVECTDPSLGKQTLAEIFDVEYSANGNIKIFRNRGQNAVYYMEREITAVFTRAGESTKLFTLARTYKKDSENLMFVSALEKDLFLKKVRGTFKKEIESALVERQQTAFSKAVREKKSFETKAVQSTLTTVLTQAEQNDNENMRISVTSTLYVPGYPNVVKMYNRVVIKETPFMKAKFALHESSDVRSTLLEFKTLYHGFIIKHWSQTEAKPLVTSLLTDINMVLLNVRFTKVDDKYRLVTALDVDFKDKDDGKVEVKLVCGDQNTMIEFRNLKIVDPIERVNQLDGSFSFRDTFLPVANREAWADTLQYGKLFGDLEIDCGSKPKPVNLAVANTFDATFTPSQTISIGHRSLRRFVYATFRRRQVSNLEFQLYKHTSLTFDHIPEVYHLPKEPFRDGVREHFVEDIIKVHNKEAFCVSKPFETIVDGLTVTTAWKEAEIKDNGTVAVSFISTFPLPANSNGVNVSHQTTFILRAEKQPRP
eukprot:GHVS01049675.1.p1 GENE.GHVS01049675.1~~GHVS01049675.1.p1  ORF type:complete len:629 (+),score=35.21 GHVS01049675.1:345-2231(+)